MQTSGLLIHLDPDDFDSKAAAALGASEGLTLGARAENAWPAVLEALDAKASVAMVRDLERMPGVGRVDVVFVGTDETGEGDK